MMAIEITKEELRTFLVTYQGLSLPTFYGDEGIENFVKQVGCIQYDPLNVVGRNPDLVLQARIKNYQPRQLHDLLYESRVLIDAPDKQLAIYHIDDWPNMTRRRERSKMTAEAVLGYRHQLIALDYVDDVISYVENYGPTMPSDIDLGKAKRDSWGHGQISSATMDYLYQAGILGVKNKRNTQKIYDLNSRLIPNQIFCLPDPFANEEEMMKWYIQRRLGAIGLFWDKSGDGWMGYYTKNTSLRKKLLQELVAEGNVKLVKVQDYKEKFYIRSIDVSKLKDSIHMQNKATFLAPLDNLLWDRKYISTIFDFNYTWEVYKPVKERIYGYYILPVLYKNKFIARFEPELYRSTKKYFEIKKWWWEENIEVDEAMLIAIDQAIDQFLDYLNAPKMKKASYRKIHKDLLTIHERYQNKQ